MLTTSQICRSSGFPASTLRYYEARGLIRASGRKGLQRLFEPAVLTRLRLIALGQAAGFSLTEIAAMLGAGGAPEIDRARLRERADEVDGAIRALERLRDGLRHVADCTAPSHLDCPRFQRILRAGAGRSPHRRTNSATARCPTAGTAPGVTQPAPRPGAGPR